MLLERVAGRRSAESGGVGAALSNERPDCTRCLTLATGRVRAGYHDIQKAHYVRSSRAADELRRLAATLAETDEQSRLRVLEGVMRAFLRKITSLTAIAAGAAAMMVVLGIVAIIGGSYDHSVVRDQLVPQKVYFPKPAEYANLKPYAGQQVIDGTQAELYANDQLAPDLNKVAGGKTYAEVSEEWIAGGMKNATLASERQTLFTGETLKGLLLNAWGWARLGSIAILAGILLIVFGLILFTLPVLNWWLNIRPENARSTPTSTAGAAPTS